VLGQGDENILLGVPGCGDDVILVGVPSRGDDDVLCASGGVNDNFSGASCIPEGEWGLILFGVLGGVNALNFGTGGRGGFCLCFSLVGEGQGRSSAVTRLREGEAAVDIDWLVVREGEAAEEIALHAAREGESAKEIGLHVVREGEAELEIGSRVVRDQASA